MRRVSHVFVALTTVVGLLQVAARAADDEMVKNPAYTHWSAFKPGTTVTQREKILFTKGTDEADYHANTGGARVVDSIYKLLEVTPTHVVVQLTLVEHGHGSLTEHAPSKITYHAMAPKLNPADSRSDIEKFTEGEEEVKVHDMTVKAHFVEYVDTDGDEMVDRKLWESDEIPGGVIKEVKKTKKGDKLIAETITHLVSLNIVK
jgi:hypothetical protein